MLPRPAGLLLNFIGLFTAGGAFLLSQTWATTTDPRDWQFFWARHYWQSAFDALSAVTGCGLMLHPAERPYTPAGRWVLAALSVAGAVAYVSAMLAAFRRNTPIANFRAMPGLVGAAGAFLALVALLTTATWLIGVLCGNAPAFRDAGLVLGPALVSFGWMPERPANGISWSIAASGLLISLGWTLWVLPIRSLRQRLLLSSGPTCLMLAGWLTFLALATLLIFLLESPRGGREASGGDTLAAQPAAHRLARAALQVAHTAGSGIQVERLAERAASDGTKMLLSAVMLAGGFPGSPIGGIGWPFICAMLLGSGTGPAVDRKMRDIASRLVLVLPLLVALVAGGLLLIEQLTAAAYQLPPSFADAFLDATSAVAGGGLTTGVTAAVTSRNLSSGIQQKVDIYQYGMAWLMLAMLLGRILPVWIVASAPRPAAPTSP